MPVSINNAPLNSQIFKTRSEKLKKDAKTHLNGEAKIFNQSEKKHSFNW